MIFDRVVWLMMMRTFVLACVYATVKRAFHSWQRAELLDADVYGVDVDAGVGAVSVGWLLGQT